MLGSVTFKEIRRCLEGAVLPFGGKVSSGIKAVAGKVEVMPGWHCLGFSTTSVERSSGQHAKHLLAVVEEASGVEDFVFDAIDSLGYERLVCIGNPLHCQGRFVDLIHQAARDRADNVPPRLAVNAIQIPSTESPDADKERSEFGLADRTWLESMYRKYGRRSLWVGSHIDARIPDVDAEQLIPPRWLDWHRSQTRPIVPQGHPIESTRCIACDLAEGVGRDSSCIVASGTTGACSRSNWGPAWACLRPPRRSAGWPGSGEVDHGRISYDKLGVGRNFPNHLATAWHHDGHSLRGRRPAARHGPAFPTYEASAAGSCGTGSTRRTWNTSRATAAPDCGGCRNRRSTSARAHTTAGWSMSSDR